MSYSLFVFAYFLIQELEPREIDKEFFRQTLRSGMNCKLSIDEMDSLMPHFDNNGFVDGSEFLLLFYKLRFDFRSKLLTERIAKENAVRARTQITEQKRQEEWEQKNVIKLVSDFSAKDKESAYAKLTEAAVKSDRLMPGAVQLDAFECESMQPHEFK